jgi:hypothetical protein
VWIKGSEKGGLAHSDPDFSRGKHDLPVVSTLNNMMRVVLQNSSADSWRTASPYTVVGYWLKDIRGGVENKSVPDFDVKPLGRTALHQRQQ